MSQTRRAWMRAVSGPLSALILVLSIAVPVLERADISHGTVVESEHDPGSCPTPHDHTVCTQASANQSAAGEAPAGPRAALEFRARPPAESRAVTEASARFDAPARAPPSD